MLVASSILRRHDDAGGVCMRSSATAVAVLLIGVTLGASKTDAMPMFARKYSVTCDYCHTTIPRLNETGYKFRAAGFRLPETLGKPEPERSIESPVCPS